MLPDPLSSSKHRGCVTEAASTIHTYIRTNIHTYIRDGFCGKGSLSRRSSLTKRDYSSTAELRSERFDLAGSELFSTDCTTNRERRVELKVVGEITVRKHQLQQ